MNRYLKFLQEFSPLLAQINMATIVIAKRTLPRHYIMAKNGEKFEIYKLKVHHCKIVTAFKMTMVLL